MPITHLDFSRKIFGSRDIPLTSEFRETEGNNMAHLNNTTKNAKGKHLTYEKRIKIEALSRAGLKSEATALQIGCSGRPMRIGKRKDKLAQQ